ncbi:hypothetical protein [Fusobacterium animalis]|jgi:hypothetical protein|uniref:hypothetical protein n=1 Tax=Fusobacterium animalis TaxID=76859 RepID=UPI0030CFF8FB
MGKVDYNQKIHKIKRKIAVLKKQKRFKESKEKKKIRIERARRLLKLGIIFEITLANIYSIELIVGYLSELKDKSQAELEIIKFNGNKILAEISIDTHDKKEVIFLSRDERKARNHKLISLGALFEMTNTEYYPLNVQVGYIESLHLLDEEQGAYYKEKGNNFMIKRRIKE